LVKGQDKQWIEDERRGNPGTMEFHFERNPRYLWCNSIRGLKRSSGAGVRRLACCNVRKVIDQESYQLQVGWE
jgi:hypothetical protein